MEAQKKKEIEDYEGYTLEEIYEHLDEKYTGRYKVLEKNEKREFKFPFFWKKKFTVRVELLNLQKPEEVSEKKKTILEALKQDKKKANGKSEIEGEKQVRDWLKEQEISSEIVEKWIDQAKKQSDVETKANLVEYMKKNIHQSLEKESAEMLNGVAVFFGVTGIGKTTTIVKIAKKIEKFKRVGIITTDNYKMGAYNQMEQYAVKMNIALKKSKVDELDFPVNAMVYGEEKELVLIDTAGRSPKQIEMQEEIEHYIREINPQRKILVLAANQKYKDMKKTIEAFKEVGITDLVITKTDETDTYGFLVNLVEEYQKPILYITDGQEVPEDIKQMNGIYWAEEMFKNFEAKDKVEI